MGSGVLLRASGGVWRLGKADWAAPGSTAAENAAAAPAKGATGDATTVVLSLEGVARAAFRFCDHARADAPGELERLGKMGFSVHILSGDHRAKVQGLARQLGLPDQAALGEQSPADKAAWITAKDRQDTLMLGDGANDSLAFDKAFCRGTPVIHRGLLEQRADFFYLGRGISGIRALFEINTIRRRTQAAILVFSVLYNLLAVGLALAGLMNPLIAAALMPANSLLTLLIVSLGMRPAFAPQP